MVTAYAALASGAAIASPAAAECTQQPGATKPAVHRELLLLVRDAHAGHERELSVMQSPDGELWVDTPAFAGWRVQPPAESTVRAGVRWHRLGAVPGLKYRFDACAQALEVDLSRVTRPLSRYSLAAEQSVVPERASPGGFVNLDVQHSRLDYRPGGETVAFMETGLFGGWGRGNQTLVARQEDFVRLDTSWTRDDPAAMRTLRIGDSVTRPGTWGRALRFAGVQWGSDFSLQPYLVTFPQVAVKGESELPSTIDVFINGAPRGSQGAEPGPFELSNIPTLSGNGELLVVVRDALGRESYIRQPFYVSPSLLKPGLTDFGLEGGWTRESYGIESGRYGDFLGSATLRRGMTDTLTQEIRLEAQGDRGALGASAFWLPRRLALFTGTLAYGRSPEEGGMLGVLAVERDVPGEYSVAARAQWAAQGFTQIGQSDAEPAPWQRLFVRAAAPVHAGGALSLAWAREDSREGTSTQVTSATYSTRFLRHGEFSLSGTLTRGATQDHSIVAGLSWPLGDRMTASVHQDRFSDGRVRDTASVQRNPGGPVGLGYRASVDRVEESREQLSATWHDERGAMSADYAHEELGGAYRVGAATGFAFLDGHAFWTRPVTGSFAVVNVAGAPGVGVFADRQLVGRTNDEGFLLIPTLRPYEINRIEIEPADIPIERQVVETSRDVVVAARTGLVVDFPVDGAIGRKLRVLWSDGRALDPAASVTDRTTGEPLAVGSGGLLYVSGVSGDHELVIQDDARRCTLKVRLSERPVKHAVENRQCESRAR